MTQRAQQKQQTRAHLLATAIAYVSAKGFLSFDTAGIASAAGLSHGTLFSHFARREDLLVEVIQTVCGKMVQAMHDKVQPGAGPRPVVNAQLRILAEQESFFCHLVAQARYLPPEAREAFTLLMAAGSHHILEALPAKRRQREACTLWWSLLEHYCLHADQFCPGKSVLTVKRREIVALWVAAIAKLKGD